MTDLMREDGGDEGKDRIFSDEKARISDFSFGEETAAVFDDMLDRSVPFYQEMQRMVGELAADFATEGSSIWDLGCSTCNTFLEIARVLDLESVRFIGLDSSEAMLKRARQKLSAYGFRYEFELRTADINEPVEVEDASVVLLLLTLQFVRPINRERLLNSIFEGLRDNGCLIIIEKVLGEDSMFNRLFIKYYHAYKKRNGYSDLEIAQKREALENVLIPYRPQENLKLLEKIGFKNIEVFFKWYNFCGIIAAK
jgi:tRNA (cmo5U34)-methyltransferase